jgi:hypothetical protein
MSLNSEARRVVERMHPRLGQVLHRWQNVRLLEYATSLWSGQNSVDCALVTNARRILLDSLRAFLNKRMPPLEVSAAIRQFENCPVLQTADHTQLVLDPTTFYTNLTFRIGA